MKKFSALRRCILSCILKEVSLPFIVVNILKFNNQTPYLLTEPKKETFLKEFIYKSFSVFNLVMHPIQIRLTRELIEKLDGFIEKGFYPNRSEAVRDAVRRLRLIV